MIQRFVVQPNEFAREQTYIERNIDGDARRVRARRQITTSRTSTTTTDLDPARRRATTTTTLDNVAALGSRRSSARCSRRPQEFQPFYRFSDVDVDRYDVGGDETPTLIGVRELDVEQHPERHVDEPAPRVHARLRRRSPRPANASRRRPARLPALRHPAARRAAARTRAARRLLRRGPRRATSSSTRKVAEQEPTASGRDRRRRSTRATAVCRCRASLRKAALALRFGDFNLFVLGPAHAAVARSSTSATSSERVETAAPFLQFDADPYPVVLDGQILWVLDGYTTTNRYPYSQSINPSSCRTAAGSTPTSTTCATR